VKYEEIIHRMKDATNVLYKIKRRNANWVGHILHRNDLLKHVMEGKIDEMIDVRGTRGR
jgi:hypothetical protein